MHKMIVGKSLSWLLLFALLLGLTSCKLTIPECSPVVAGAIQRITFDAEDLYQRLQKRYPSNAERDADIERVGDLFDNLQLRFELSGDKDAKIYGLITKANQLFELHMRSRVRNGPNPVALEKHWGRLLASLTAIYQAEISGVNCNERLIYPN